MTWLDLDSDVGLDSDVDLDLESRIRFWLDTQTDR